MGIVLLFDVDGTLTSPMKCIEPDMIQCLRRMKEKGYKLSVVGGSDYAKISHQLTGALDLFDYICCENGLVTYSGGEIIESNSLLNEIGDAVYQDIINAILLELSQIKIPIKRDKFIETRTSCINVSPIGRSCSYDERIEFYNYDKAHGIRVKLIISLLGILEIHNMTAAIGGMISIDIYPKGWDKTYCLKFFSDEILFFGDRTEPGGNDHLIYIDKLVKGYSVTGPNHLIEILSSMKDI